LPLVYKMAKQVVTVIRKKPSDPSMKNVSKRLTTRFVHGESISSALSRFPPSRPGATSFALAPLSGSKDLDVQLLSNEVL